MSKQIFTTTERAWSAEVEKQLVLSMKQAGAEEEQIAIEQGRNHHGVPAVTVIVDGGCLKEATNTVTTSNLMWLLLLERRPRSCSS